MTGGRKYRLEHGSYYLFDGEEIVSMSDEVSVGYAIEAETGNFIFYKHGSPEAVQKWYEKTRKRLADAGDFDMAGELRVASGKFRVEELNRLLGNSNYLKRFLEVHGLAEPEGEEQSPPASLLGV